MKQELMNLFLFIGICFVLYMGFRNFNFRMTEGMTDASGNTTSSSTSTSSSSSSSTNGVAGNAASYGATIQSQNIKMQDTFLISQYRTNYETVILNLDTLLNNLMLQTALSINPTSPGDSIAQLASMNQAKLALNNVMTYIDKQ